MYLLGLLIIDQLSLEILFVLQNNLVIDIRATLIDIEAVKKKKFLGLFGLFP